jgi:hypothetical protein
VPTSLHAYANVFSEKAFDSLPERRKWDHAIELEHEPSPGFHKVYLMTLTEQMEMDAFPVEALATGCIRQSKSPLEHLGSRQDVSMEVIGFRCNPWRWYRGEERKYI